MFRYRTVSVSERSATGVSPCSSRSSSSTSSAEKLQNHRSARASMLGRPRPRTVSQMMMLGLVLEKGRAENASSSYAKS